MVFALLGAAGAHAADTLPGATRLQRQVDMLREAPATRTAPPVLVPTLPPLASPTALQQRQDTRLTLTAIDLRGVTQLTPDDIAPLFETLNGQETSLAEVDNAVAALTGLYESKGYILSRAFLPEQEIRDGVIIIQVLEGKLEDVEVIANDRTHENPLVQKLLARIDRDNPTRQNLETILLQLNDMPGLAASANLSPGSAQGTATLAVTLTETRGTATMGYSNHGTRYIGPQRFETGTTLNNILSPGGDTFTFSGLNTPNLSDLSLGYASYSLPLNSHGTTLEVGAFKGISRPKWTLEALDINSKSAGANLTLSQNLIRTRALTWDTYAMLDWQDAESTSLGQQLSADHTRALRLGTGTATTDGFHGFNTTRLELSHGLDVMGATRRGSTEASRLRGHGEGYTKAKMDLSRLQGLNETWNLLLAGSGQFSTHALLAGEEFGLGGEGFGRGYDTNEISGEHGLATRAELQATFHPDTNWLEAWQLFGFYDYGMVWNKDRDAFQSNQADTLSSIGYGARLQFTPSLSGELMFAKPMTHVVASNGDKNPTIYFRLKGKFDVPGQKPERQTPAKAKIGQTTAPTHKEGDS